MDTVNEDAASRLRQMLSGKWVTAALSTAAELGIADALDEAPRTAAKLAQHLECREDELRRLLRVLAGEGLVTADPHGVFDLTELGRQLCDGQLRDLARFVGADFVWSPWSHLPGTIRSGGSAFEAATGSPLFDYLDQHPKAAHLYNVAVDAFTRQEAQALARSFDFSESRRVVDLGGGLGTLLVELRRSWPHLECVLFDRPKVVAAARARLSAERDSRITFVGGDFFRDPPPAADVFVIKHVLHNWDDERAVALLRRCADQLEPQGFVLAIEGLLLPGNRRDGTRLMDLEMLVLCGAGRERSKPEFRSLFAQAGLRLQATPDLAGTTRLLVAQKR